MTTQNPHACPRCGGTEFFNSWHNLDKTGAQGSKCCNCGALLENNSFFDPLRLSSKPYTNKLEDKAK